MTAFLSVPHCGQWITASPFDRTIRNCPHCGQCTRYPLLPCCIAGFIFIIINTLSFILTVSFRKGKRTDDKNLDLRRMLPGGCSAPADHRVRKEKHGIVASLCIASISLFIIVENGHFSPFLLLIIVFLLTLP